MPVPTPANSSDESPGRPSAAIRSSTSAVDSTSTKALAALPARRSAMNATIAAASRPSLSRGGGRSVRPWQHCVIDASLIHAPG